MNIPRMHQLQFIGRFIPLFQVRAKRALLEALSVLVLMVCLWELCILLVAQRSPGLVVLAVELMILTSNVVPCCWLLLRWRLRPQPRSRKHQVAVEVALTGLLFFMLISCDTLLALLLSAQQGSILHGSNVLSRIGDIQRATLMLSFVCSSLFLFVRFDLQVVLMWNRLRRTRLLWSLTHAHLMVVLIGAGILGLFGTVVLFISAMNSQSFRGLSSYILFLFLMAFMTIVAMACVLPPSALFSYVFTRRLTRRLELLASATSALRDGNYAIRVDVDGQDEIASLQANFNAMAADLERTMRELKEERDNVSTLLNARRELIASVSHELRTPVATVRSYLESALSNWQEGLPSETLKSDLYVIQQQTIRLQSLINDLFTLARAEVGRLEMRCELTGVDLVVQRVVETIAPVAWRSSRVEVLSSVASIKPAFPLVLIDGHRLEQILHNLIHNSIRHTPPGGIIVVSADADEQSILLQVKDTGEGIAEEELPRIWERFYRAQNSGSRPGTGTGLGLAIVKELTEAMRGSVAVESTLGQGTCFTLRFPISHELVNTVSAPVTGSLLKDEISSSL